MSLETVEWIAKAVLYEGYMLYPYRPSSVKNRRRFNFGVLTPPAYSAAQSGENSSMRTECLLLGDWATALDIQIRFLQVMPEAANASNSGWQAAMERQVVLPDSRLGALTESEIRLPFQFGGEPAGEIAGTLSVSARAIEEGVFRVAAELQNQTAYQMAEGSSREDALRYSFSAAHTILAAKGGEFVSLIDPPEHLRRAAEACRNSGTWPVLAGEPGERNYLLSAPIILYDYPQIAPESPGDLFDGTEIDEILTLRIMTLTDEEKAEMRNSDERARRILERTESLPEEHFMKLHGALRGLRPTEESR